MTAEIQEILATYLEQAGCFIIEQAPDVIRQLLIFQKCSYIVFGIILFVSSIFSALLLKRGINYLNRNDYEKEGKDIAYAITGGVCFFICSILFLGILNDFLMITLAPKIYLLKQLKGG
jgi:hypothetical protein